MVYVSIGVAGLILLAMISVSAICVSLQEAGDPSEARPEDLSEFEKRHVRRTDIPRRA